MIAPTLVCCLEEPSAREMLAGVLARILPTGWRMFSTLCLKASKIFLGDLRCVCVDGNFRIRGFSFFAIRMPRIASA